MTKKIAIFMMLMFLLFLFGKASLVQAAADSAAGNAIPTATYEIDGVWIITAFIADLNLTVDLSTIIVGSDDKLIFALSKDMEAGFAATCKVDADQVTITMTTTGPIGSATGIVDGPNAMHGDLFGVGGNPVGTWTAIRNTLPPAPNFDIRGIWFLIFENEPASPYFAWPATFSGSKTDGWFQLWNIISKYIEIIFPQGIFTVNGDQLHISMNNGATTLDATIVDENLLDGTYSYNNSEGSGSGAWCALLLALPGYNPPFGAVETPVDGSPAAGSVPVTGWALAGRGVEKVEIFLLDGGNRLYLSEALFIDGARPDIEDAYPMYPNSSNGGWGYMLLTNFLPNGGNGTYTLEAVATDYVGNSISLGTTTIYCDNANAVKPFGAIDTPVPGKTASGSSYKNNGWVLTPQPDTIPTDGSTINVYVDGVNLGHPAYNIYRSDIASLFPGYANSNGAGGSFTLDTTPYQDGLHFIFWTAKDSNGDEEGIGSRYFVINNSDGSSAQSEQKIGILGNQMKSGFDLGKGFSKLPGQFPFKNGLWGARDGSAAQAAGAAVINPSDLQKMTIKELQPLEIRLGENIIAVQDIQGYLLVGNRLRDLPVGSTLDVKQGKFNWVPGPGFLGKYTMVFEIKGTDGRVSKKSYEITVNPKFAKRKTLE